MNLLYVTIICYTLISHPPPQKKNTCGFTIASSFSTCFDPFARCGLIGPSTSSIAHHRDPRKMSPSRGNVRGNHPERGKSHKNWSHAIPRFLDIPKTISILCLGSRFLDELVSTLIGAWSWFAIILHLLLECYNVTHAVRVSGESWWRSDDLGMTGYKLTFCCVAARKNWSSQCELGFGHTNGPGDLIFLNREPWVWIVN